MKSRKKGKRKTDKKQQNKEETYLVGLAHWRPPPVQHHVTASRIIIDKAIRTCYLPL
jgi:hypothetical protein